MRVELASLNHCAVFFLSRTDANFFWYYYKITFMLKNPFLENLRVIHAQKLFVMKINSGMGKKENALTAVTMNTVSPD